VKIPKKIRIGDTIKWRDDATTDVFGDDVTSADWTLTYYLRTNASNGHTVASTSYLTGWETTIAASATASFVEGDWFWQALATKGSEKLTLGTGSLEVLKSYSYSGSPSAVDGRSQAVKDLEAIQAAIRTIVSGGVVQEYKIGSRDLKKYDLADLIMLENKYKAEVVREQKAEKIANGLGNPHSLHIRLRG
jgi:hypothetical protein